MDDASARVMALELARLTLINLDLAYKRNHAVNLLTKCYLGYTHFRYSKQLVFKNNLNIVIVTALRFYYSLLGFKGADLTSKEKMKKKLRK